MITIRRSAERGHADQGWLNSYYTFSFASYYDPAHMGFRALRVINEDRIAPGRGFGAHAHRDMEIMTYVLEGSLTHRDSMGEIQTFGANTIQVMSAGTGVIHSEFNGSEGEPGHFLQIWIEPAVLDVEPSYQQISFDPQEKRGRFRLLAAPAGSDHGEAAEIHQDASVYAAELGSGENLNRTLAPGRHAWVQVARGNVTVNGEALGEGDAAAAGDERELSFTGGPGGCELLYFDLA
ncbi:MAG TPA: pirin family protein [Bryobacteraceae bacterium]|nr:pirin family protein [Bryobacteraceae bacterium]